MTQDAKLPDNLLQFPVPRPDEPERLILGCTNCNSRHFKLTAHTTSPTPMLQAECANCEMVMNDIRFQYEADDT